MLSKGGEIYTDLVGELRRQNAVLVVVIVCLAAISLGSVGFAIVEHRDARFRWGWIRIDGIGNASTVNGEEYRPQQAEVSRALRNFVEKFYSRAHSSQNWVFRKDYTEAFYYLDAAYGRALADRDRKGVDVFLSNTSEQEVYSRVLQINFEENQAAPYRASVEVEKLFYEANRAQLEDPVRRERWTLRIVFDVLGPQAKSQHVNPLGISIQSIREQPYFGGLAGAQ